jgi:hypothetical protein
VLLPSSIYDVFAAKVAIGEVVVLIVTLRVRVSTTEQQELVKLIVKVVFEMISKMRFPLEGDTGIDEPVVLSVIVAVSAFVVAHERFTEVPGITQ